MPNIKIGERFITISDEDGKKILSKDGQFAYDQATNQDVPVPDSSPASTLRMGVLVDYEVPGFYGTVLSTGLLTQTDKTQGLKVETQKRHGSVGDTNLRTQ